MFFKCLISIKVGSSSSFEWEWSLFIFFYLLCGVNSFDFLCSAGLDEFHDIFDFLE